jgi:hypothetical protein
MKKFFIRATAIILLLLLFLYAFLEYRQYRSYNIPMHANATMMIKLNTDAFIRSFIVEYGFNFKSKIKTSDQKEKDTALATGLQIPANVFVYSVHLQKGDAFFCTLKLTDADAFQDYCRQQFQLSWAASGSFMKGSRDNITVLCNKEYAAIAFFQNQEQATAILEDVLNKKNLMARNHPLIQKIKQQREHITFVSADAVATAVLSDKELALHAVAASIKNFTIPATNKKRVFSKDACASFYCNGIPAASLFKQTYSVKQYSLVTDSILSRMTGYIDIEMLGSITQKDTVTTYEYDDNFEKKEKQTIAEVKIPLLRMVCDAAVPSLITYLQQQGFVIAGKKINKEVFPLYAVSVAGSQDQLQLQTGEGQQINQQFVPSPAFLGADVDFVKLRTLHDFSILNKYSKGISRFTLSGTQNREQQVDLHGTFLFQQSALHSLIELAKNF